MLYRRFTINPVSAAGNTVARFGDYHAAQRAAGGLSDDGFPAAQLDIIGSGIRLAGRVTGRLTRTRASAAGAVSGIWAGLFIGILFGLFTSGHTWLAVLAAGARFGALWGAVSRFATHAATGGQRDFSSFRRLSAAHYGLIARGGGAERARGPLAQARLPSAGPD